MRYFYILGILGVGLIGAYVAGNRVGVARCRANVSEQTISVYVQMIKNKEKINEQTNHTAVRDIRRILHERYTIAQ